MVHRGYQNNRFQLERETVLHSLLGGQGGISRESAIIVATPVAVCWYK
jgi:hypothetical protein